MSGLEAALASVLPGTPAATKRAEPLVVGLAGIVVRIEGAPEPLRHILARRFEGWIGPEIGVEGLIVRLSWLPAGVRLPGLGADEEYRLEAGGVLLGRASVAVGLPGAAIAAAVAADPAVAGQEVENVLRLAVAAHLLGSGGLLLHAGAVGLGEGALVFPAASGTGKSTLVRELAAVGLPPLGDDMAAVTPGPTGWTVRPLPFTGEVVLRGRPGARELVAVHPLARGAGPVLEPLDGAAAAAAIAHQVLGLALFPRLADRGLETAARLAAGVPVERLRRSRGDATAALLRARHGAGP